MKHWRIGLLGVGVSLLAIYFIVSQVDMALLGEALASARYIYVLPTLLLLIVGQWTRAKRWQLLLGGALPLKRAFSITNISYLVNGILPLRMGEVARVVLANRGEPPIPVLKSASSIIVERMLDLLAVLILLGFALTLNPTLPADYRSTAALLLPLLVLAFAVLILLVRQRRRVRGLMTGVVERAPLLQRFRLTEWLDQFLDGLAPLTRFDLLLPALFWTAVSWGISTLAGYILMFAFYDTASWSATALYIAAAAFVIAVPAVPGNIGTYEWAIMLAMAASGYGQATDEVNVSFAVIVHAVNLVVFALMGTLGFIQEGITLDQLTRQVQNLDDQTAAKQETYVSERTQAR